MSSIQYGSREEWLQARRGLLTASDVAAVLGVDPHRDSLSVYADKIGAGEQEDSLVLRRGRRFEAAIADEFAEELGVVVHDPGLTIYQHPRYPWLGATIDRWYAHHDKSDVAGEYGSMIPLQIKLGLGSYKDWKEETPKHYQIQVLIEAAVMSAPFGTIAGLIGPGPLACADIPYDDELFSLIVPQLEEFMSRVADRVPPEPQSGLAIEPLKRIWPGANGKTVDLSHPSLGHNFVAGATAINCGAIVERRNSLFGYQCGREPEEHFETYLMAADSWDRNKAESKRLAEQADEDQAVLRHALGGAQFGALPDGSYIERKKTKSRDVIQRIWPKRGRR